MNKLEEYRDKLWTDFISSEESFGVEHDEAFEKGFDAVIALDLPVKFGRWLSQEYNPVDGINYWQDHEEGEFKTTEDLYKYWIENIFKYE